MKGGPHVRRVMPNGGYCHWQCGEERRVGKKRVAYADGRGGICQREPCVLEEDLATWTTRRRQLAVGNKATAHQHEQLGDRRCATANQRAPLGRRPDHVAPIFTGVCTRSQRDPPPFAGCCCDYIIASCHSLSPSPSPSRPSAVVHALRLAMPVPLTPAASEYDSDACSVMSTSSCFAGSQATSATSHDVDMRSASPAPSVYSVTSSIRAASYRHEYGRGINNYSDVYRLPADDEEFERLGTRPPYIRRVSGVASQTDSPPPDQQHNIFMEVMGKYPPPLAQIVADDTPGEPKTCIDLGCGSGSWQVTCSLVSGRL